jgi:hypothetical protein
MDYREADKLMFSVIEECGESLAKTVHETKFPRTYSALLLLMTKAATLKMAMYDLLDELNIYPFKVVYRSFCEHYLKFLYIWYRFLDEKSDDVGRDYYTYCGVREILDFAKALKAAHGILGHDVIVKYSELVQKMVPNLDNISRTELEEKSDRFRYRNIIRYIADKAPQIVSEQSQFLVTIIPEYAYLSTYVHGGPTLDRTMDELISDAGLESAREEASIVFIMNASIFMFVAMAMSREFPSLSEVTGRANYVINKYLKSSSE